MFARPPSLTDAYIISYASAMFAHTIARILFMQ